MGLHFNILTDDETMLNYLALYLAIKGYTPKGSNKKVYPNAKEALSMLGIPTTNDPLNEDIRWD